MSDETMREAATRRLAALRERLMPGLANPLAYFYASRIDVLFLLNEIEVLQRKLEHAEKQLEAL